MFHIQGRKEESRQPEEGSTEGVLTRPRLSSGLTDTFTILAPVVSRSGKDDGQMRAARKYPHHEPRSRMTSTPILSLPTNGHHFRTLISEGDRSPILEFISEKEDVRNSLILIDAKP